MPYSNASAVFSLQVWGECVIETHKMSVNRAGRSMGFSISHTSVSKVDAISTQAAMEMFN